MPVDKGMRVEDGPLGSKLVMVASVRVDVDI